MINIKYKKAYTEVLEIIKYFPEEEYNKISKDKIEFYRNNMDKDYKFKINPNIDLSEQNISPEANAIIVNLYMEYFANEDQKIKIKEILDLNQEKLENQKKEKYNTDNIFKKSSNNNEVINMDSLNSDTNTSLIGSKESFFTKFKNFILKFLNINKNY